MTTSRPAAPVPAWLVVVGLQLGRLDETVLPALARLVAAHRPDRLLLLFGPPLSSRSSESSAGGGVEVALAAFRATHHGPIDLQLPTWPKARHADLSVPQQPVNAGLLRRLRVRLLPKSHEIRPGWVCTVASDVDIDGRYPGLAAINLARRTGTSTIIGGTDRSGMIGETTLAPDGTRHTLWGMEVTALPITGPTRGTPPRAGLGILHVSPAGQAAATVIPVPTASPHPDRQHGHA